MDTPNPDWLWSQLQDFIEADLVVPIIGRELLWARIRGERYLSFLNNRSVEFTSGVRTRARRHESVEPSVEAGRELKVQLKSDTGWADLSVCFTSLIRGTPHAAVRS